MTEGFYFFKVESSKQQLASKEMNKTQYTKKPFRSFYGPGKFVFAIYPDYWKESWGQKPLLGHVTADDEFYAEREAYSKNLLTVNYTFGVKAVKLHVARYNNASNTR